MRCGCKRILHYDSRDLYGLLSPAKPISLSLHHMSITMGEKLDQYRLNVLSEYKRCANKAARALKDEIQIDGAYQAILLEKRDKLLVTLMVSGETKLLMLIYAWSILSMFNTINSSLRFCWNAMFQRLLHVHSKCKKPATWFATCIKPTEDDSPTISPETSVSSFPIPLCIKNKRCLSNAFVQHI